MDYLYFKVEDANFSDHTPLRQLFREHLKRVAKALHDIEWVDSSDYGAGEEDKAILAVLQANPKEDFKAIIDEQITKLQELKEKL